MREEREAKEQEERAAREAAEAAAAAAAAEEAERAAEEAQDAENEENEMQGVETSQAGEPQVAAESSAAAGPTPRVTYRLRDREIDLTSLGIDPEFLDAIPPEMREEVLIAQVMQHRASLGQGSAEAPRFDEEFLAAAAAGDAGGNHPGGSHGAAPPTARGSQETPSRSCANGSGSRCRRDEP